MGMPLPIADMGWYDGGPLALKIGRAVGNRRHVSAGIIFRLFRGIPPAKGGRSLAQPIRPGDC